MLRRCQTLARNTMLTRELHEFIFESETLPSVRSPLVRTWDACSHNVTQRIKQVQHPLPPTTTTEGPCYAMMTTIYGLWTCRFCAKFHPLEPHLPRQLFFPRCSSWLTHSVPSANGSANVRLSGSVSSQSIYQTTLSLPFVHSPLIHTLYLILAGARRAK